MGATAKVKKQTRERQARENSRKTAKEANPRKMFHFQRRGKPLQTRANPRRAIGGTVYFQCGNNGKKCKPMQKNGLIFNVESTICIRKLPASWADSSRKQGKLLLSSKQFIFLQEWEWEASAGMGSFRCLALGMGREAGGPSFSWNGKLPLSC